jgi:hypothetical protein
MEPNTQDKIASLEKKIDAIYVSVEKTRKYFFWTMVITLALVILPLIGLAFAIPSFMTNYVGSLQSITQ